MSCERPRLDRDGGQDIRPMRETGRLADVPYRQAGDELALAVRSVFLLRGRPLGGSLAIEGVVLDNLDPMLSSRGETGYAMKRYP